MAKAPKKTVSGAGNPAMAKRYSSIAEIKRDLFPNAAAEEAATISGRQDGGYEKLMNEFFGGRKPL